MEPATTVRRIGTLLAIGLAVLAATAESADGMPAPPTAGLNSILGELRQGGFVIFFRHAATSRDPGGSQVEDLTRCETQRTLSPQGRGEAIQIGNSIRALGIPIGTVTASPYCRAKETAQLAFGHFREDDNLGFVVGTNAEETERLAQWLRQRLATPPEKGGNSVIVSHSANLYEAAGIFAKPEGVAYVFRPSGDNRFEAVARILPGDWRDAGMPGRPKPVIGK